VEVRDTIVTTVAFGKHPVNRLGMAVQTVRDLSAEFAPVF
jgi:hypothetical protein